MKMKEFSAVIAERELDGQFEGKPCKVTIRFGAPQQDESGSWNCPFSISSPRGELRRYGAGVDSLQALRIALAMAAAQLGALYSDLNLSWDGQDDLGL